MLCLLSHDPPDNVCSKLKSSFDLLKQIYQLVKYMFTLNTIRFSLSSSTVSGGFPINNYLCLIFGRNDEWFKLWQDGLLQSKDVETYINSVSPSGVLFWLQLKVCRQGSLSKLTWGIYPHSFQLSTWRKLPVQMQNRGGKCFPRPTYTKRIIWSL